MDEKGEMNDFFWMKKGLGVWAGTVTSVGVIGFISIGWTLGFRVELYGWTLKP